MGSARVPVEFDLCAVLAVPVPVGILMTETARAWVGLVALMLEVWTWLARITVVLGTIVFVHLLARRWCGSR